VKPTKPGPLSGLALSEEDRKHTAAGASEPDAIARPRGWQSIAPASDAPGLYNARWQHRPRRPAGRNS
ncbi:MAG: hypothetical protein AAGK66_12475, partial [Pseudomonadota bacterium]